MKHKEKRLDILSLMPCTSFDVAQWYDISHKLAHMRLSYYEKIGLIKRTGEKDGRFLIFNEN
jgi:hypothetical protein